MAKVTSKLQVTLPKRIADAYGIAPGDDIEFVEAGDSIRIVLKGARQTMELSTAERLRLFDEATERQRLRDEAWRKSRSASGTAPSAESPDRGWTREELYVRGKPR
jgi:AbrB family looped-hinge helix DNA binding protein